jgi:DNA segregation ATPase FtsK/SpoIIIE-like protein
MLEEENSSQLESSRTVATALGTSWYAKAALAGMVLLVIAGYWFRDPIADSYFSARDAVIGILGLGFVPAVLWLAVFTWTLFNRRSWFRHINLWAGSVALVAFSLGVMAFFQPFQGALATFSLYGDVSLGGSVGHAIIGSATWLGALRLLGIFIVGVAIVSPSLATDAALAIGRLFAYGYILVVVGLRAIGKMYRFERSSRRHKGDASEALSSDARVEEPYNPALEVGQGDFRLQPDGSRASQSVNQILFGQSPPGEANDFERGHDSPLFDAALAGTTYGYKPYESNGDHRQDLGNLSDSTQTPDVSEADLDNEAFQQDDHEVQDNDIFTDVPENTASVEEASASQGVPSKFNKLWDVAEPKGDSLQESGNREDAPANNQMSREHVSEWSRPPTNLLVDAPEGGITQAEMNETAEIIRKTLSEYGVEVQIGQMRPGPAVTMYGLIPGWVRRYKQMKQTDELGRPVLDESGKPMMTREETKSRVKVDNILSREKDLALALKTPSIRIETPVMGESLVGIEVPNSKLSAVTLRSVMESEEFTRLRTRAHLPVALGKGSGGETVVIDLAKMPHLLIAGATGSGKSVCLNTIVSCLITEKTPAEMRLMLIDPKRVELTPYNGIPHLLTPVIVETDQVVGQLKGAIREMMDRYRRMEDVGVRNIEAYNKKRHDKMPFLVVVLDELADLMMSAAFDVEQALCRLAQLGRATGIHLIVATQRPSVDVVTGLIKANFPSRISFAVTSQVDSRTILDSAGADRLLGRGDMLYLPIDASRPARVQGVFITDREIENLVSFWETVPRGPLPQISLHAVADEVNYDDAQSFDDSTDELLQKAIELAYSHKKLSTSLLQRRLRIGYPRAGRLMDQLEEQGIVSPGDGSKSRDVIIS